MSKGISSAAFVLFAAVCIFAGCSIKEDRSQCPCILELDFSGNGRFDRLDFGVSSGDDFLYRDMVGNRDFGQPYRLEVPRSGVYLNVYSFASSDGRADGYGGGAAVMGETEFIDSDRTSLILDMIFLCDHIADDSIGPGMPACIYVFQSDRYREGDAFGIRPVEEELQCVVYKASFGVGLSSGARCRREDRRVRP